MTPDTTNVSVLLLTWANSVADNTLAAVSVALVIVTLVVSTVAERWVGLDSILGERPPLTPSCGGDETCVSALIQMKASMKREENHDRAEEFLKEAASRGAEVACLQEIFATWFFPQILDPSRRSWLSRLTVPR